jgi:hypothetical protein
MIIYYFNRVIDIGPWYAAIHTGKQPTGAWFKAMDQIHDEELIHWQQPEVLEDMRS